MTNVVVAAVIVAVVMAVAALMGGGIDSLLYLQRLLWLQEFIVRLQVAGTKKAPPGGTN
jgi:hypothetical protein